MYIALKPCSFGAGNAYLIGDTIPNQVVMPGAAKRLQKMGIIAAVGDDGAASPSTVAPAAPVPVDGVTINVADMELHLNSAGMQAVFDVLTGKAAQAEKIINEITCGDALILIHEADNRKSVKEAATERALSLTENGGEA